MPESGKVYIKDGKVVIDVCYHREYTPDHFTAILKDHRQWLRLLLKGKQLLDESLNASSQKRR